MTNVATWHVDRLSPLPLYEQVRRAIERNVEQGFFEPGDSLPPERELIERFNVSRTTIRQAMDALEASDLVERIQGRGTFVRPRIEQRLALLTGWQEEVGPRGISPSARLLSAEEVSFPPEVAEGLRLAKGHRLVRLELGNDQPMALDISYLPSSIAVPFIEWGPEKPLYTFIEQYQGVQLESAEQTIQAVNAEQFQADCLAVPLGAALLLMHRLTSAVDGRRVEYVDTFYRGDAYAYALRLPRR
ncbi:MAG: GntR family transcriptional regulator [Chloroflexota bacterium]